MKRLTVLLVCSALACSTASFNGSVNGRTFKPQDAIFIAHAYAGDANFQLPDAVNVYVLLNDTGNACSDTNARIDHGNETSLEFQLTTLGSGHAALTEGTYPVALGFDTNSRGNFAAALLLALDAQCNETPTGQVTGGQVHVTHVQSTQLQAEFDLDFGSDHVTGSFTASGCNARAPGEAESTADFFFPLQDPQLAQDTAITCKL